MKLQLFDNQTKYTLVIALLGILVVFTSIVSAGSIVGYQPPAFSLEDFEKDFSHMKANDIDPQKPLTWIYYFTGYTQQSLVSAASHFTKIGFTPTGMYTDKTVNFYWLEVENKTAHTPKSLIEQVSNFQQIAKELKLRSLEKIDVKP